VPDAFHPLFILEAKVPDAFHPLFIHFSSSLFILTLFILFIHGQRSGDDPIERLSCSDDGGTAESGVTRY